MQLTQAHTATACVSHMCIPRALVVYYTPIIIYSIYALVGEAISTRDLYICANESHTVFHSENIAIGFKTSIEVYFVKKNSVGTPELIEVSKLHHNF